MMRVWRSRPSRKAVSVSGVDFVGGGGESEGMFMVVLYCQEGRATHRNKTMAMSKGTKITRVSHSMSLRVAG